LHDDAYNCDIILVRGKDAFRDDGVFAFFC
jgi:hypothetical protein